MDAERAITIVETLLAPKSLNIVQTQIIRGVIAGASYQQIVVATAADAPDSFGKKASGRYKIGYVKETGAQLWQSLSLRLGQKVTKKSLAAVLFWYAKQQELSLAPNGTSSSTTLRPTTDWGAGIVAPGSEFATAERFYGRIEELATLTNWCDRDRCRTISIVGMGGMGKSTLAWELAHRLECSFELTIWRSLLNAPTAIELCSDLLRFLSPRSVGELPATIEGQIELLLGCFQRNRCLSILDNVESILADGVRSGRYLPGYEDYDLLFKAIGELPHQSCLLLTSREQPQTLTRLQVANPQLVRSLTLGGLSLDWGHQLVRSYGCVDLPQQMWQEIHAHYSGNPLALKIAAITAIELTGGGKKILELYPLMREGKLPFRNIDDILQRQFDRLSAVEQQLVYWLAIEREPITSTQLRADLLPTATIQGEILNALQSLLRRSIVIRQDRSWTLPPVAIAHVTHRAIEIIVAEISQPLDRIEPDSNGERLQQQFVHLNTYAIIRATAKDYLRQAQIRSSLLPIVDRLLAIWIDRAVACAHLRQILRCWQGLSPPPPGYLAGNILNLLTELAPDRSIADLDCSGLPIWSAYLVDVKLRQVNFAGAAFARSVFTQAFGGVVSATFNPAGDLVATGDANGDIYLWRLADGQRVATYQGHSNWTRAIAFSPDGQLLASASDDCTVKFWDVATGTAIATIGPHTHSFRGIRFSRDGRQLVTGGDDGLIRIYDLLGLLADAPHPTVAGRCIQVLDGHTNWVLSTAANADESQLASASADGTVRIWNLVTSECTHVLPHDFWTIRTIFRPHSYELIVAGMSATIYVWETRSGELVRTLTGHTDWVWSIECSADGRTLYSTGEDRTIRVWDLTDGACQTVIRAHHQRIWTLALAPDGQQLVSGSEDRTIKIWDLYATKCLKTLSGFSNRIEAIAIVADRGWLVSSHQDRMLRIWDLPTLTCIQTLAAHSDAVTRMAISPDGNYLATSSLDATSAQLCQQMRIWSLHDLTCLQAIVTEGEGSWDRAMVFSPDSCQLITGSSDRQLEIWNVATGQLVKSIGLNDHAADSSPPVRIRSIAVCRVHHLIATACENELLLTDLHSGACRQAISAHDLPISCVTFSADGNYLASSSMDKTVKIWAVATGECVQTLVGHQSWVLSIAFSPTPVAYGGRTDYQLISAGCDREIHRWDIATGKCLQTYTGHTNWVWSIVYSQDGSTIISASEDETIAVWEIDRSQSVQTIRLDRPYEAMNIAGATGLLPGQRQSLALLGAIDA